MKIYYKNKNGVLYNGNALEILKELPDNSIDVVVTSPPYWCYSEDTEVLTFDGWKKISDVKVGELVMTLNPETKEMEWGKVVATKKWYYQGKMVHFKGKLIDLLVTPNHKMYVENKRGEPIYPRNEYLKRTGRRTYLIEAKDIKHGHLLPITGFRWKGGEQKYFELPECEIIYNKRKIKYPKKVIRMEDWLAFFGIWLAEGSVRGSKGGKRKSYEVMIKQKEPNASKIRQLLTKLPFEFKEYRGTNGLIQFSITDPQLWYYLSKFGNSKTKYIPREIKELSPKYLQILLDWYFFGDGTIKVRRCNGKTYYYLSAHTVSKRLLDDIMELAIKVGYNISVHNDGRTFNIVKTRRTDLRRHKEVTDYEGYVVGIEVDRHHIILVRRNYKAVFSGNSKRDYGEAAETVWPDKWKGQLGLEPTPEMFIDHLLDIFDEVKRVLKPTGSLFVNIDDTYIGGGHGRDRKWVGRHDVPKVKWPDHIPKKSMALIPEMFAYRMVYERGWILREKLIWAKKILVYKDNESIGNAMPEPVRDRTTHAYEFVYHFTKSPKYYFNPDPVRTRLKEESIARAYRGVESGKLTGVHKGITLEKKVQYHEKIKRMHLHPKLAPGQTRLFKNPAEDGVVTVRRVRKDFRKYLKGKINASGLDIKELSERTGIPEKVLRTYIRKNGRIPTREDWTKLSSVLDLDRYDNFIIEEKKIAVPVKHPYGANPVDVVQINLKPFRGAHFAVFPPELPEFLIKMTCPKFTCPKCGLPYTPVKELRDGEVVIEHHQSCDCSDEEPIPGVVLDPFAGAGTTLYVAQKLGCRWIGIEISEEYCEIIQKRIENA